MKTQQRPYYETSLEQPIVYVIDDDEAVRVSLKWLFESVGLNVRAYQNGHDFLNAAVSTNVGCALVDVRMPYMGGFELQQALNSSGFTLPIIFLSAHGDIPMVVRAMREGAYDFLEKPFNDQALLDKVQAAILLSHRQSSNEKSRAKTAQLLELLSSREQEVLKKIVEGKASKTVARELAISYRTVEAHRARIREKTGVGSLAELVRLVIEQRSDLSP